MKHALLCLCAAWIGLWSAPDDPSPSIEREWRVRRWALDPLAHDAALVAARSDARWEVRRSAWQSLARARRLRPGEAWERAAVAAVQDRHPNVRAAALAAGRHFDIDLDEAVSSSLVADPMPLVRIEVARWLGARRLDAASVATLETLTRDDDPRVAEAATVALMSGAGPTAELNLARVRLVTRLAASGADEGALEALEMIARTDPPAELVDGLRAGFADPAFEAAEDTRRKWLALVEALGLSLLGSGDADVLIDGWIADGPGTSKRRELLRSVHRSRNIAAGDALLSAAWALEHRGDLRPLPIRRRPAGPEMLAVRWPGLERDLSSLGREAAAARIDDLLYEFVEVAGGCLGPMRLARRANEWPNPEGVSMLALQETRRLAGRWDPEVVRALVGIDKPRTWRLRAVRAFGDSLLHGHDTELGKVLVELLDDGDAGMSRAAFGILVDAQQPGEFVIPLYDYWRELPPEKQLEALPFLPRRAPLHAFRDDLIALGEPPGETRRDVIELLESLTGDQRVRAVFEAWLAQDLAALEATRDSLHRYVEMRVMALVRGLHRVAEEESLSTIHRALDRSLGLSTDVGKTAAAALGQSAAGRAILADYLRPMVDRRTRIEVGIALAPRGDERAQAVLIQDFEHATWDLRSRMLAALGESEPQAAAGFLTQVALDRSHPADQRPDAAAALARLGPHAAAIDAADRIAREAVDLATRRAAIAALGRIGGEAAAARLTALWTAVVDARGGRATAGLEDLVKQSVSDLVLLEEDLLAALGRSGHFPASMEAVLLEKPIARASADLEHRFRGDTLASIDFEWRGYLDLASELAVSRRLDRALDAGGGCERLDARLALAFGERAAVAGELSAARRLFRVAYIGLEGEFDRDPWTFATARFSALSAALEDRAWEEAAALATELNHDWIAGHLPGGVRSRFLGTYDAEARVDPRGHLVAIAAQARAWLALENRSGEEAREWAARARAAMGVSERASRMQQLLEDALER